MTFMCLAVLVLLFGGMFLFVKQKLAMMEARLNLLSETISTMAGITMNSIENKETHESDHSEHSDSEHSDSEHSDSDSESEHSESESDSEIEIEEYKMPDLVNVETIPRVDDVIVEPIKIIVSDDDVTSVKQIVVDTSYESLTVKELKEKISELNGPKLKTKKEMIEYLKNKI